MTKVKEADVLEGRFSLPRHLEISNIEAVARDVMQFIGKPYKKFILDAGEVALIDTAGIQLIVQLLRNFRATGCEISWINDSVQIYQMAAELGLADQLDG